MGFGAGAAVGIEVVVIMMVQGGVTASCSLEMMGWSYGVGAIPAPGVFVNVARLKDGNISLLFFSFFRTTNVHTI